MPAVLLFGFLMMAMIVLLSGMIQSEKRIVKDPSISALDNSPPDVQQPVIITVAEVSQSVIVTWISASMPGVFNYYSSNIETIMNEDMLSMNYLLYNDHNSFYRICQTGQSNKFIYRLPRDGLRES